MARILLTIFALTIFSTIAKAEEECVCKDYTDEEKAQIWDFLSKLSGEMSGEEGVLPGMLSPLVPCGNCVEGARKKRTALPAVLDSSDSIDADEDDIEDVLFFKDSRCPVGYKRIAFRCINLRDH